VDLDANFRFRRPVSSHGIVLSRLVARNAHVPCPNMANGIRDIVTASDCCGAAIGGRNAGMSLVKLR
jgi:hypothetical protein